MQMVRTCRMVGAMALAGMLLLSVPTSAQNADRQTMRQQNQTRITAVLGRLAKVQATTRLSALQLKMATSFARQAERLSRKNDSAAHIFVGLAERLVDLAEGKAVAQ